MFGKDFLFGVSLSGFQFEMGAKESVDPNTDWFVWVRDEVNLISGLVSGDLPEYGPDYWNRYAQDHELMAGAGMNAVRIGVEWSRIFPKSTEGVKVKVEREGNSVTRVEVDEEVLSELEKIADMEVVEHYREIMRDIKEKGLHLIVDLNHFTLPLWLHDPVKVRKYGVDSVKESGWYSIDSVIEFAKFAAFCAKHFDDLVDEWSTMNEPQVVSSLGYLLITSGFPPAYPSIEAYVRSMINQAQAHARAYDSIKRYSKKKVGIIYSFSPVHPSSKEAKKFVERASYYQNTWFMDMVTKGVVGKLFDGMEEIERPDMKDRVDFIGINYYTRMVIEEGGAMGWRPAAGYGYSCQPLSRSKDGYPTSEFGWEIYPKGLYETIEMLHRRYGLEMIVTENGIADSEDRLRPYFLVAHLAALEKALEKGYPVRGYLHWSIIDNYEWAQGFEKRFGLVRVDYPTKERQPRPSYYVYSQIISRRTTKGLAESLPF